MKRFLLLLLIIPCFLYSLSFREIENLPIPGVSFSSVDWGDYNNNGRLDLLITGDTGEGVNRFISRVYSNDPDGSFTHQEHIRLTGVIQGGGIWGDINNNGLLDIIICGAITNDLNTLITRIYLNDGEGGFVQADILLPGVKNGFVKLVDYNNNGWLDLFLGGELANGDFTASLYRNERGENFTLIEDFQFPGSLRGDAAFIDFNGNGYKDLVLTGRDFARVYVNNRGEQFTLQNQIELPNVRNSSVDWGDYNNDGLPDLLLTGISGNNRITRVYRNIEGRLLEWQQDIALTGVRMGRGIWADMNNNGRLDILINGEAGTNNIITKVYLNSDANTFTEVQDLNLIGARSSDIQAVDINNNGKLDLIITGLTPDDDNQQTTKIYLNTINRVNTPPQPPTRFYTSIDDDVVVLSWNRGADEETSEDGLNYNIVLQKTGQDNFIVAPNSNIQNGFRRLKEIGNAGYNLFYKINGLSIGSYRWAVQTIDTAGAGSTFSAWQMFDVMPKPRNISIIRADNNIRISWDRVEEAEYYRIYGSRDPYSSQWQFLGQVTETFWVTEEQHSSYFYKVTAGR